MPPHSYLNSPVTNTTELMHEVKTDDQVMDRYMRHFGMTQDQVVAFMSSLHLGRIKTTKLYTIYFAREGGYLDMKPQLLKAGRKVFMNSKDEPILMESCGNPMVAPTGTPASMIHVSPLNTDVVRLEDIPANLAPEAYQEASVVEPGVSPLPVLAEIPQPPIEIPGTAPQSIPILNEGVGALAFLPLLGIHGGGESPHIVPEPATLGILAVGLAGIGYRRRRKSS